MLKQFLIAFLGAVCLFGSAANAQTSVTFVVDATDFVGSGGILNANRVSIAGNFNARGGNLPDWDPTQGLMTAVGSTLIFSKTVTFTGANVGLDSLQWKYVQGIAWTDGDEGNDWANPVPRSCTKGSPDNNRKFLLPSSGNLTIFSKWAECPTVTVTGPPLLTTSSVSAIATNTATCGGNVVDQGSAAVTERGVCWSTSANPTTALTTKTVNGTGTGSFSSSLTGLLPSTTYFVRAYATNTSGTSYGNQVQFTTQALAGQSVTVTYKVDITNYLAGGAVLAANGMRIAGNFTTRGATVPNWDPPAAGSAMTNEGNNIWSISVTYPDSAIGKKQLYKFVNGNWGADELSDSVVINGCGEGADKNRFLIIPATNTTKTYCWERCASCILALPSLTTTGSTGITQNSVISGGTITSTGSAPVTARGVVWSTSQNPTVALTTKTVNGTGSGNFVSNITGLLPNTTYFARAYATSSVGTAYGNQIQFTTLPQSQTISVTYKVDITNYLAGGATLGANGIRIGGNFTTRGASLPNWTPSAPACAMTNEGNNIWSITVVYPDSAIGKVQRYKFINNDWGTNEGSDSLLSGGCGVLDGTDVNRILTLPATNQTYSFCWDRCRACAPLVANTITTVAATAITQNSATVGGIAVGQNIAARGIAYATTPNPTVLSTLAGTGFGAGTFSGNLTNLIPNTLYYARAYITVGNTTTYGNQIQFTTAPAGQGVTVTYKVDITNYLAGGAILGANGIRIGGNFTTRGAGLPDWTPSAAGCAMTNEGNNVWSISVTYPDSAKGKAQRYKFVNNDWGTNEGSDSLISGGCGVLDGTDRNRILTIPNTNQTYTFCWDRCGACVVSPTATVSTTSATGVTQTTATVGGIAVGTGITARGVVYGTSANPTLANSVVTSGTGAGTFSASLTGLTANTPYFARAYITVGNTTTYGNQVQFTTLAAVQGVSVTYKVDITNYLAGGAVLGANGIRIAGNFTARGATALPDWTPSAAPCAMTNEGNNVWSITITYPDSAKGKKQLYKFVNNDWGTNEGSDSVIAGGCGEGVDFNRFLIIPNTNQTYSYCWDRCHACIVAPTATVSTTAATGVTQTTALVGGIAAGTGITARGVVYGTAANPTLANSVATSGTGAGTFSASLTGLTANTPFFARAYITVGNTTTYGNQIQFTTLAAGQGVTVTYKVDITNYLAGGAVLDATGIRIAGNFTTRGAGIPDWTPTAAPSAMTNLGNNIWSIDVTYPDSAKGKKQLYKFVNGNWGAGLNENSDSVVAGGCGEGPDKNRFLIIPNTNQTYAFCWERCRACVVSPTATITTSAATGVTQTTATVGGQATGTGITARGVVYGTAANPTLANSVVTSGTGAGTFSASLTGLTANTPYFARAYITVGNTTTYGNQVQFTTLAAGQGVTVTYKVDITNYLAGGAVLGANGIRIGGNFTTRGAGLPDWTPSAVACAMTNEGNNVWSISVTYPDSAKGKAQRYKFVNNDWGTNEGSDSLIAGGCGVLDGADRNRILTIPNTNQTYTFCWDRCSACVVSSLATVTTSATVAGVTQTAATVSGDAAGTGITRRGICFGLNPLPTIADSLRISGAGAGTITGTLTGLTANTTYYARAFATNAAGTAYGNQVSFTTLPQAGQPVVVTYKVDITNYLAGGAVLGANGIRIGGNFTTRGASLPDWTPSAAACAMTNEGNNVWSISVTYPDSAKGKAQRYKFVNNDWGTNEGSDSLVAGGCGVLDGADRNRLLTIPNTNQTYAYCWDLCHGCVPVSVSGVEKAEPMKVFPNPFQEDIQVEIPGRMAGKAFVITNLLGEKILEGNLNPGTKTISGKGLPKGSYFLKADGEPTVIRIMKM